MTDNIFISYSKILTKDLAVTITQLIKYFYKGKDVKVLSDPDNVNLGYLADLIDDNIEKANIGVLLLTPENYASEWLMFEAGALTQIVKSKDSVLIPYLFCRNPNQIEQPLRRWLFTRYIYKGAESSNYYGFVQLFKYINQNLERVNRVSIVDIENRIHELWESEYRESLHNLAQNLTEASASVDKSLHNIENDYISLDGMRTKSQFDLSLTDSITPKTPRELETALEFKLNEIPSRLRKQNYQDKNFGATRVILNNTRFSTFVTLTDSRRIVLYDRKKASRNKTNVLNDRYDVFGSVQFENRTLNKKISSQKFLDSPIQAIREINGAAIEDNENMAGEDDTVYSRETAVMFGICVYMTPEDLNLAVEDTDNNEIIIVDVSSAKNWESSQLTSKARLAVRYLSSQTN